MSTLPPGDDKTKAPKPINAFSLIEVVIAIGIVSFALLGIIGLFSATLKTNKDASAQQEGFEIQRMLLSKMQDTNQFPYLGTNAVIANTLRQICNMVWRNANTTNYFLYTSNNGGILTTVMTNVAPASTASYSGILYYVQITAASNIPTAFINIYAGITPAGSFSLSNFPFWPSLPLHAIVYSIPTPTSTSAALISNSTPVISFDFIIPK